MPARFDFSWEQSERLNVPDNLEPCLRATAIQGKGNKPDSARGTYNLSSALLSLPKLKRRPVAAHNSSALLSGAARGVPGSPA